MSFGFVPLTQNGNIDGRYKKARDFKNKVINNYQNQQNNNYPNQQNNNYQNQQNQQNNNNQNPNDKKGGKFCNCAMYPKDNDNELIDLINDQIAQENNNVIINKFQNQSSLYLKLLCSRNIEKNLMELTGKPLQGDKIYYFTIIPNKINEDQLSALVNEKFITELYEPDDKRLNLSNLSEKFKIPVINSYVASFILFLCAIKCFSEKIEINEINFENNGQANTMGFNNICILFPELQRVFFAGNPLKNDKNMFLPFIFPPDSGRPDVELITKELGSAKWGRLHQQVSMPFKINLKRVIKGNTIESTRPKFNLNNFVPATINPNTSPVHRFILAFFDRQWKDLPNIAEFYFENSVFSVTVDICSENSPLSRNFFNKKLDQSNQNTINRDFLALSPGEIAVGPEKIADMQFKIFGGGFYANLSSFVINFLTDQMCAVVCHGAFHKTENGVGNIFCFDRSLFIGTYDNRIFISNDHIFIRAGKLPGSF